MALHQDFSNLLEQNKTETSLRKGVRGDSVATLQHMLHQMGFGDELKWDAYGADGDYGGATTTAVQAFGKKNALDTDGQSIGLELGARILQRFMLIPRIKRLYRALHRKNVAQAFPLDGQEESALHPLLKALGFTGDNEAAALQAFAQKHGLSFDGRSLPEPLARKLFDEVSGLYGSSLPALLLFEPPNIDLTIDSRKHVARGNSVASHTVRMGDMEVEFKGFGSLGGYYENGKLEPKGFIEQHWEAFFQDSGLSDSARKVILAVSLNEGKLDAINTWDRAFLSFGMFQWTLGTGDGPAQGMGELPALLLKAKQQQPEAFGEYFSPFGIDIDEGRTNATYGFLTLRGELISRRQQKEQFRTPEWGFRFWHAGQDPRIQAIEIGHALSRLNNFYWKERRELQGHKLAELINSEYGVALLLDQNVNRGIDVYSTVGDVLNGFSLNNIANWSDEDEQRLIEKYLARREQTVMHDPKGRARRIREIAGEGPNQLSMRRGSFSFLKDRSRSILSTDAAPAPPPGYREEDYPDIIVESRGQE